VRSAELEQIVELLFARQKSSDPATRTIQERRDRLDGLANVFPLPDDVVRTEIALGGVQAVRLEPPGAGDDVLLYFHGGGYGGGLARSHSELAARLARAAGATAILPEYRLAPEHSFPAALDDAVAAFRALLVELDGDAGRLVVGGDSAGGGLAVAMCVALRDAGEPLPRAISLLSPWLDLTCSSPSWDERFKGDPVLDHVWPIFPITPEAVASTARVGRFLATT